MKVGVYVDVAYVTRNGGYGMRYEVLRSFACRGSADAIRLNAYVSIDQERARTDSEYEAKQHRFFSALRDVGYKVIQKDVSWYADESGNRVAKSNVDVDLAVDALLQSANLDRVVIASGDADFTQVVRAMQNRGTRVEVIGFDNVAKHLRGEADLYISGYLVPNLLPVDRQPSAQRWGDIGSLTRGVCFSHDNNKQYGWIRYLHTLEADLWKTDPREPNSPFSTIFFHDSELPEGIDPSTLPNRDMIFEFEIAEGTEAGKRRAVALEGIETCT